jgi:hypothetical protein
MERPDYTDYKDEIHYPNGQIEDQYRENDYVEDLNLYIDHLEKQLELTAVGCQREQFCDKCDKGVIWNDDGISGESCSCVK